MVDISFSFVIISKVCCFFGGDFSKKVYICYLVKNVYFFVKVIFERMMCFVCNYRVGVCIYYLRSRLNWNKFDRCYLFDGY